MCHLCGNVFSFAESLHRHILTVHSDEKPYKCHICQRRFNRRHNLTIHIRTVHERTRTAAKRTECLCDHCGKVLRSQQSLREHVSVKHTKIPLYKCDKCHSAFYRKLTFVKHKATPDCRHVDAGRKAPSPQRATEDVNFLRQCEICGLEFSKRYYYELHALKHATKFTCSRCELEFTSLADLRGHEDAQHPELNPFVCEECGKRFKRQSLLHSHSVTHRNERKFECDECATRFSKKKYLVAHMTRHTGERPYVCSICNKGFRQSGDMRKHKARHLMEAKEARRGSVWTQ